MDEVIYISDDKVKDLTSDTVQEDETRTDEKSIPKGKRSTLKIPHHRKKTDHIQTIQTTTTYHYNMIRMVAQK